MLLTVRKCTGLRRSLVIGNEEDLSDLLERGRALCPGHTMCVRRVGHGRAQAPESLALHSTVCLLPLTTHCMSMSGTALTSFSLAEDSVGRMAKGSSVQLLEKWETWEKGEEEKETGCRRLGPTGLGPGIQEESFPLGQGTSPLLFHIPALAGKPDASLQRLLGEGTCPFLKPAFLHTPLLPHSLSSPLGKASKNIMDLAECCDTSPMESVLLRAEHRSQDSSLSFKTFLAANI